MIAPPPIPAHAPAVQAQGALLLMIAAADEARELRERVTLIPTTIPRSAMP